MEAMYRKESIEIEHGKCAAYHFCKVTVRLQGKWSWQDGYENVIGEATAKRSSKDRNDEYIGENLALARALEIVANKLTKRTAGHIKHYDDVKLQRRAKEAKRLPTPILHRINLPIFWRNDIGKRRVK